MAQKILVIAIDRLMASLENYFDEGEYVVPFKSEELANCVVSHSAAVAVSGMAAGVLPVAGSIASLGICVAANWRMYIKICEIIKVPFGQTKLKAIASAVISNILGNLALFIGVQMASSVILGVGIVTEGILCFFVTYFAGYVFLNLLTELFNERRKDINIDDMTEDEIKEYVKKEVLKASRDKKGIFKEVKNTFVQMREDGSLDEAGKNIDISDDEI